jgi:6-phosphogluconolactonase (cycloisomerase 2 family)
MKLRYIGRAVWAGAVSVGLAVGIAACGKDNTIDYLFVANAANSPGQINVYLVDGESGSLTQIPDSPYRSGATNGGRNPIALATTPNLLYLYVLNHDDNTIVKFGIGTDAKLYPQNTYNTPGNNPTSLRVNAAGTFLFVTDAFQPQYNATTPGPGAVVVYPINAADGTLGTPITDTTTGTPYFPVCNNPVDIDLLANGTTVYVVDDPASQPPKLAQSVASEAVGANGTSTIQYTASGGCTADSGQISAFTLGSSGALTPVAGSPFAVGVAPTAIASDPTSSFVYVADYTQNVLLAYAAQSNGGLTAIGNAAISTGTGPNSVTIDPSGAYVYVANYGGTLSAFGISSTGALTSLTGTAVNAGPTSVFVEPRGKYLYTAGYVDNTVYGSELNTSSGTLNAVQGTPFPAAGQPTAIAAITHGHSAGATQN